MSSPALKILLMCLLLTPIGAFSQRTETAVYFSEDRRRLVFEIENDLLFQTDSYYTAGIAISFTHKGLKKSPAQLMLNLFGKKNCGIAGFGLQQRIFTPYSIENPNSIANDRPYSAYLLLTNYAVHLNAKKRLLISNELGIGAMGPMAGGEEVQSFVHELLGNALPVGWDNQLNNAPLIDYHLRLEKSFFHGFVAEHFIPFTEVRVGTLTDRVKFGLKMRFGNKSQSMLDWANSRTTNHKFIWEWILSANLQGVFYDATLQGGVLNKDETIALPRQDVIEQQYQVRMGINFYVDCFSFRYMVKLNSSDFVNAVVHRYGSVNLSFSF